MQAESGPVVSGEERDVGLGDDGCASRPDCGGDFKGTCFTM